MPQSTSFTDLEKVTITANVLDADGQPFAPGTLPGVTFVSSDPLVAPVTTLPGGLSCEVLSGSVGVAVITISVGALSDTVDVEVVNSAPGTLSVMVSPPSPE